ncbi:TPA: BppU family phage baseplate upper protein [Bacillus nitratireducens]|nr:hypothetical protein bcere0029_10280 [Bacillus cereus AH1272]EEL94937.1 hypothetical protein bcere0030_10440 [Bacillus cereus AH1273]GCF73382.1 hypothetical protein BC2926_09230 [Bacillus cereus]
MIYKDGNIKLNADAVADTVLTSIVFESHDIDTARLLMRIEKDRQALPLSALTAKLFMKFSDGSVDFDDAVINDKVDGLVSYILKGNMMRPGIVGAELYLYYDNKQILSTHKFTFRINKSMIDEDNTGLAEYYVSDFEKLKNEVYTTVEEIQSVLETVKGQINTALSKFEEDSTALLNDSLAKINEAQQQFDSIVNDAAVVVNEAKKINIPFLQQAQTEMQGLKKDVSDTNKRMDNIVANGNKDNTEIVDARLGADGVARGSVGTLIREIHKNTMETEKKTQLLQHGVNVVNASVPSPLGIEVPGRTLVNLLGNKGNMVDSDGDGMADLFTSKFNMAKTPEVIHKNGRLWQVAYSVPEDKFTSRGLSSPFKLDKGKKYIALVDCYTDEDKVRGHLYFHLTNDTNAAKIFDVPKGVVVVQYLKFNPAEDIDRLVIYNYSDVGLTTSIGYSNMRIYEVDDATYNKIDLDPEYVGQKLADKFPYVEGVKHLNPVISAEGENLFPPFTEWNLHANAKIMSPYEMELEANGSYQMSTVDIKVIPNQDYYIAVESNKFLEVWSKDGKTGLAFGKGKFNVGNLTEIRVRFLNDTEKGKFHFRNPMLTLGDKPKPFVPKNTSYLYTNAILAGLNGINDVLYKDGTEWKVLRKWERDFPLDKLPNWRHNTNFTGYKRLLSDQPANIVALSGNMYAVSPNGTVLKGEAYSTAAQSNDAVGTGNTTFFLTVSNTVSGWGEAYTPSTDEILAFLNGWAVKTADTNGKPTAWKSIVDGSDAPTQTLAFVKANKAVNYTPYKLTYQLLKPTIEVVQVEGDIVVDGPTQVTVDSGVVVREKVPFDSGTKKGVLSKASAKVIAVYKELEPEPFTTYIENGQTYPQLMNNVDAAKNYYVTYLLMNKHKYTTNAVDVKTTYNQSVRSTIDDMNVRQSDNTTMISIHSALLVDILARLKAEEMKK